MTTTEILKAAREKIATPEKWTKHSLARDAHGMDLEYALDKRAVCWCAAGAMDCAAGRPTRPEDEFWLLFDSVTGTTDTAKWNDAPERAHAEVLAAFDRAIEMAEGAS